MKKITLLISAFMMTVATTFAQTWYAGYPNPQDVTVEYTGSGLIITGTGEMQDFVSINIPWNDFLWEIYSIVVEEGVTRIGSGFSYYPNLTTLTISASVKTIGDFAFAGCYELTTLNFPANGLTTIGAAAFQVCYGLSGSLTIPNGVTTIGSSAFNQCYKLSSLTIPESVTTIEDNAFGGCRGITSVNNYATVPQSIIRDVFYNLTLSNITLNVPVSSLAWYQEAEVWQDFDVKGLYYKVKATAGNEVHGAVSADAWYELNDNASLIATPAEDYEFVNWTKDGIAVSAENPYIFPVTEDVELTANFRSTTVSLNDVPAEKVVVAGYYSTAGARLSQEPQSGVYIVVYENGKSEKVVRKK